MITKFGVFLIPCLIFALISLPDKITGDSPASLYIPQIHEVYSCLKTLNKPGEGCDLHPSYPNTMQCAETKRCISKNQFKDGNCDCCGENVTCSKCYDHSDENRVPPPGGKECQNNPDYTPGTSFQCAIRRDLCLPLTVVRNLRCDCCPEVDGDCCHANCTDHSDEECMADQWNKTFTCDGNCLSIDKFSDSNADCSFHCVEGNADARKSCEASRSEGAIKQAEVTCEQLKTSQTPFYKCPTGLRQCITLDKVHDNTPDCQNGEDESSTLNPPCDEITKEEECASDDTECYAIDKGTQYLCR